jgi:hypothetical protein
MKKAIVTTLILSVLLFFAATAMASVYRFDVSYGSLGTVNVSYGSSYNGTAYTTDFNVTSSDVSLDPSKAAYCVDLFDDIGPGTYYGMLLPLTTLVPGTGNTYLSAAALLEQYGEAYDADNDSQEERLQLAIWETLYENSSNPYDLGNGDFTSTSYSFYNTADGLDIAGQDISAYRVLRFTDADGNPLGKQDLLVKVNSVPVPGAIWLLGSGFLGLVCIRRRCRQ